MKLLLVQFNSNLLTENENPQAKKYYDRLYSTRPGYNRLGPTWEIPQWIAEMKRNFPDADFLFADTVPQIQDEQNRYTHLAFSALDCNWHLIRTIADAYSGKVIVGGYCDKENLTDLHNVFWFDSVQNCCNFLDVEYKTGVDYTAFAGAKTIARLTLSTGCRHKCKFCIVSDDVVKTPIDDVYQQADEICRLNSPLVYLNDKTFGQCENFWLLPLLFKRCSYDMPHFDGFIIQTTASQLLKLDDDYLLASGVRYVELGIESYNDTVLQPLNKPTNEIQIDKAVQKLRRLGIRLIPNLIIGLPGETRQTYVHTLYWLEANADVISHVNVYNLAIYDDAELADDAGDNTNRDENRIAGDDAGKDFASAVYAFGMGQL